MGKGTDTARLEELYRDFMPAVYRLAFALLRDRGEAELVVRDCFLHLARGGMRFRRRRQIRCWLMKAAAKRSWEQLRRRRG